MQYFKFNKQYDRLYSSRSIKSVFLKMLFFAVPTWKFPGPSFFNILIIIHMLLKILHTFNYGEFYKANTRDTILAYLEYCLAFR